MSERCEHGVLRSMECHFVASARWRALSSNSPGHISLASISLSYTPLAAYLLIGCMAVVSIRE